jgi:outer membrane protein
MLEERMRWTIALLAVALVSAPRAASATRAMTLPDALAHARAHQPEIRVALARIDARRAEADVARADWYPVVGATAQIFGATASNTTGTYVGPGVMDVPRIGATRTLTSVTPESLRPYPSTLVGLGVGQEVFDFGRIAAQSAAADALVDIERQHARAATMDVAFDVEEAYYAVFAAKAVVKASEDAFDRAHAHRDLAKAGVDAGLRPPIELTRADADLSRFDLGRVRAQSGVAIAQTVLAAAVGVSDPLLDVTGEPPTSAELPDLGRAIREASARDPRVLAAILELRAQEQKTSAVGARLRPDLSFTGSVTGRAGGAPPTTGTAPEGDGWLPYIPNWDAGLVFTWPIFDETVRAREQASRSLEQVRRAQVSLVGHEQVVAIRRAFVAVDVARTALPTLQRSVDAARANYAQADARFRAGLGTSVELADAEALRADAEIQLVLGVFQIARARAGFGRAIAQGS